MFQDDAEIVDDFLQTTLYSFWIDVYVYMFQAQRDVEQFNNKYVGFNPSTNSSKILNSLSSCLQSSAADVDDTDDANNDDDDDDDSDEAITTINITQSTDILETSNNAETTETGQLSNFTETPDATEQRGDNYTETNYTTQGTEYCYYYSCYYIRSVEMLVGGMLLAADIGRSLAVHCPSNRLT